MQLSDKFRAPLPLERRLVQPVLSGCVEIIAAAVRLSPDPAVVLGIMTAGIPRRKILRRRHCNECAATLWRGLASSGDYQVAFPSDCNASFDEGMHQASLKTIDMFFGRVMTSDELLDEMRNELGRNDRVAAE